MPGLLSRYPLADIVNMRILLELCPLAGLALVLWYKLLKPYDRMLALSQEVEKMRDWPREYHLTEDPAYSESASSYAPLGSR